MISFDEIIGKDNWFTERLANNLKDYKRRIIDSNDIIEMYKKYPIECTILFGCHDKIHIKSLFTSSNTDKKITDFIDSFFPVAYKCAIQDIEKNQNIRLDSSDKLTLLYNFCNKLISDDPEKTLSDYSESDMQSAKNEILAFNQYLCTIYKKLNKKLNESKTSSYLHGIRFTLMARFQAWFDTMKFKKTRPIIKDAIFYTVYPFSYGDNEDISMSRYNVPYIEQKKGDYIKYYINIEYRNMHYNIQEKLDVAPLFLLMNNIYFNSTLTSMNSELGYNIPDKDDMSSNFMYDMNVYEVTMDYDNKTYKVLFFIDRDRDEISWFSVKDVYVYELNSKESNNNIFDKRKFIDFFGSAHIDEQFLEKEDTVDIEDIVKTLYRNKEFTQKIESICQSDLRLYVNDLYQIFCKYYKFDTKQVKSRKEFIDNFIYFNSYLNSPNFLSSSDNCASTLNLSLNTLLSEHMNMLKDELYKLLDEKKFHCDSESSSMNNFYFKVNNPTIQSVKMESIPFMDHDHHKRYTLEMIINVEYFQYIKNIECHYASATQDYKMLIHIYPDKTEVVLADEPDKPNVFFAEGFNGKVWNINQSICNSCGIHYNKTFYFNLQYANTHRMVKSKSLIVFHEYMSDHVLKSIAKVLNYSNNMIYGATKDIINAFSKIVDIKMQESISSSKKKEFVFTDKKAHDFIEKEKQNHIKKYLEKEAKSLSNPDKAKDIKIQYKGDFMNMFTEMVYFFGANKLKCLPLIHFDDKTITMYGSPYSNNITCAIDKEEVLHEDSNLVCQQ